MKVIMLLLGFALSMAKGLASEAKVERTPAHSQSKHSELLDEYLMIKNHVAPRETKAKVYIFNRDINKKNYAKKKMKAEYYDLY